MRSRIRTLRTRPKDKWSLHVQSVAMRRATEPAADMTPARRQRNRSGSEAAPFLLSRRGASRCHSGPHGREGRAFLRSRRARLSGCTPFGVTLFGDADALSAFNHTLDHISRTVKRLSFPPPFRRSWNGPPAGSLHRKLGHAVVVGAVETALEGFVVHPAATISGGDPAPLRGIDGSIAGAARPFIEKRHPTVLRRQHRIGADRVLD